MDQALRLDGVCRAFGGLQAVDGVTLTVRPGERRALIGPNGAGKTTLFNLIAGAMPLSSGRIALFGRDVTHAPAHRRAALGLARTFQITNLFPDLSVMENCLLAVQAHLPVRFSKMTVEVEEGFTAEQTRHEVERCLNCDVQTHFTDSLCIECDACIDICPTDCLTIIPDLGSEVALRTHTLTA